MDAVLPVRRSGDSRRSRNDSQSNCATAGRPSHTDSSSGARSQRDTSARLALPAAVVNVRLVQSSINVTDVTASKLLERLAQVNLVEEITGQRRNRVYRYTPYWQLFQPTVDANEPEIPPQSTESET